MCECVLRNPKADKFLLSFVECVCAVKDYSYWTTQIIVQFYYFYFFHVEVINGR